VTDLASDESGLYSGTVEALLKDASHPVPGSGLREQLSQGGGAGIYSSISGGQFITVTGGFEHFP